MPPVLNVNKTSRTPPMINKMPCLVSVQLSSPDSVLVWLFSVVFKLNLCVGYCVSELSVLKAFTLLFRTSELLTESFVTFCRDGSSETLKSLLSCSALFVSEFCTPVLIVCSSETLLFLSIFCLFKII